MIEEETNEGIELFNIQILNEEELEIYAETVIAEAGDNLTKQGSAINQICEKLYQINDSVQQSLLIERIAKKHKIAKKVINDKIKTLKSSSDEIQPRIKDPLEDFVGIDRMAAMRMGFFEHKNCIYFLTKDGVMKGANFVIRPLFHIYSKQDNKRLVEIINEEGQKKIIDIPSKNFISVEMFQQTVYNEGNFLFNGTKHHFFKVLENISKKFPVCNEIRTLGWQREGFYAFANGIYNGNWQPVDDYGIVTHRDQKYFLPAFSTVYKNVREDDDEYETDRYLVYKNSPITFNQWSKLMIDVYGDNGIIGMAYNIACCFRDLIYEKYKIFPHLFLFGEKQSGKSQLAWSLSNLFFHGKPAFNLSSGTQVGFARNLSRVKNAFCWHDEWANDIDIKRQQTIKSAYDGMGHEKGKATKDNRTEITKVLQGLGISGQYLPTVDDNAIFTRSILLSFVKRKYSAEEIARYDELKQYEQLGLSSLVCEVLNHRQCLEEGYGMSFSELMEKMKDDLIQSGQPFEERLVRNFCTILTPVKLILESMLPLELNFTFDHLYALAIKMIPELSRQISSSESLSNFWMMTEYLLDNKMIENEKDFEIKTISSLKAVNKKGLLTNEEFSEPKSVLFIRFSKIHPMYMEYHRKQFGKNGIDLVSLTHYIKNSHAFMGYVNSYRFSDSVSSCYAFDYEQLFVNLERNQRQIPGDDQPF